MIEIDGSRGEGGGQILRTALALSVITGKDVHFTHIRAGRKKPGLARQHLACVEAAQSICGADVVGAEQGSQELTFCPGPCHGGTVSIDIGSAGSTTLVLQTVLPALMQGTDESRLRIQGGTHNPSAPPFDFLCNTFLPLLARMGPEVALRLERPGFFPGGGGCIEAVVRPSEHLTPLTLLERGEVQRLEAHALLSRLAAHIAGRELEVVGRRLRLERSACHTRMMKGAKGPGNVVLVEAVCDHVTETFTAFGRKGLPAPAVGNAVAEEVLRWLGADVPVGTFLADQLLLPLALAGGGSFRTLLPSAHARTNMETIELFLDVSFATSRSGNEAWLVEVKT